MGDRFRSILDYLLALFQLKSVVKSEMPKYIYVILFMGSHK